MKSIEKQYGKVRERALQAYAKGDIDAALPSLRYLARRDDPIAQRALAVIYDRGDSVPVDLDRREYWIGRLIKTALSDRSMEAQTVLSSMYREGQILFRDIGAANFWLARAAKNGDGEAQSRLSSYDMEHKPRSQSTPRIHSESAHTQEQFKEIRTRASRAYWDEDFATAVPLLTELAEAGDLDSEEFLVDIYLDEERGLVDHAKHRYWAEKVIEAAENGSTDAQNRLAYNYRMGRFMLRFDNGAADYWLEIAAKNGNPESQYELHFRVRDGDFTFDKDPEKGQYWFDKAIEQKYPEALWFYSRNFWENGKPTQKAVDLWIEAAKQGFHPAVEHLKELKIDF